MTDRPSRSVRVHHGTSLPSHFLGRTAELALLDAALTPDGPAVIALVGPGGQGKTAIVQHWLEPFLRGDRPADGVFLWSFYRGRDVDLCLRELYAQLHGSDHVGEVSATFCVDRSLPRLRSGRWVVVLDGVEVVQYEAGDWYGRCVHPELGRLLEELAGEPLPGVVLVTSRFPLPELERRPFARTVSLSGLDPDSARELLRDLGVHGDPADLDAATDACGRHAKAVELLGTYLTRYRGGEAAAWRDSLGGDGAGDEEERVRRVLGAFQRSLPEETQDLLALATAFREPPPEARLRDYLHSAPVRSLLHDHWGRQYLPFADRPTDWLLAVLDDLVALRLLERLPATGSGQGTVLDAHPLVRRGFENVLGAAGQRQSAAARAGFLRGRPDRRKAASLEEAREEIELFHAYCDAGLWEEADLTLTGLDRPRYRFLAPALERDLLLRFFPQGDWRKPASWPRFDRHRGLAICLELLGDFAQAIEAYREADAVLRGDALLALGRLEPLLGLLQPPPQWQVLGKAYRAHALTLAGRTDEALKLAGTLVPMDVYEWAHVFECLLRCDRLDLIDVRSFLYRPPRADGQQWSELARRRMRADYLRRTAPATDLSAEYQTLVEEYDRGGLPLERTLARLGQGRWLLGHGRADAAADVSATAVDVARRHAMRILEADALALQADVAAALGQSDRVAESRRAEEASRAAVGYRGPGRP